ncbi:prepilin peptidase [Candidatus Dojkabacteria bacterium]|uniref:Prepilin peptidase n=1 Tax=Candidatus Dojkabacteria bacterium TaxID=2099670 RepID=A0A955L881_9BACT|nr:prepilin peptidase [Candidatus Dojkabacteria bacterium]
MKLRSHFIRYIALSSIIALLLGVVFYQKMVVTQALDIQHFFWLFFLIVNCIVLIYLGIVDFVSFEVPDLLTKVYIGILITINIGLMLLGGLHTEHLLWESTAFIPIHNLIGGFSAGSFFYFLVTATKEKAMGAGDIRIACIMGLLLGISKLLVAFYITILSACLVGLVYAGYKKQFKGLKIPFVPFMVFGTITSIIFYDAILIILQSRGLV